MITTQNIHQAYIGSILEHDWEKVEELLHTEYTYTGGDGKELIGPGTGVAAAKMMTGAFPDLHIDIKAVYTSGKIAIGEMIISGTHQGDLMNIAPTGNKMTLPVALILELRDDRIYREREYFDMMSLINQLGVISPPVHT